MSVDVGQIEGSLKINLSEWTSKLEKGIADALRAAKAIDAGLTRAGEQASVALGDVAAATESAGAKARDAGGRFLTLGGDAKDAGTKMRAAAVEGSRFGDAMRATLGVAGMVSPRLGQVASGFMAIESAAKAAGISIRLAIPVVAAAATAAALMRAAFNFTAEGIKLSAEMEQTSIAFEVMIGSAALAKKTLADLKDFADTTPFKFDEIAGAAKQLLAMGIDAKDVVVALRRLGDVSAGLGQPLGEMAYLFGQIKSQGRAMTQDLNQFAGRGVPIYKALADTLHTTELGVRELAESGQIGFAQIERAIASMTDEGGKFFGMTARQSKSLAGQISTLEDAWDGVKRAAGDAFNSSAGKEVLGELMKGIENLKPAIADAAVALAGAVNYVLPALRELLKSVKAITDAAGVTNRYGEGTSAAPDQSEALKSAGRTSAGTKSVRQIAASYSDVNSAAAAGLAAIQANDPRGQLIGDQLLKRITAAMSANSPAQGQLKKDLATLQTFEADLQSGKGVDPAAWQTVVASVQTFMRQTDAAAQVVRDVNTELAKIKTSDNTPFTEATKIAANSQTQALRDRYADAQRALRPLVDAANAAKAAAAPAASPATTAAQSAGAVGQAAAAAQSPKQTAATAVREAAKEMRDAKHDAEDFQASLERAAQATAEARIAALHTAGKELDADLAQAAEKFRRLMEKAVAPEEKTALAGQLQAEQAEIKKKAADELKKKKDDADEEAKRSNKKNADEFRDSVERTADFAMQAQLTLLKAYGKEYEATLLEIEGRFRDRMRRAVTEDERKAATSLRDAERAAANKAKADDDAKRGVVDRGPLYNARQALNAAKGGPRKALAELDMRDATHGGLNAADAARRDRLRKQLDIGSDGTPSTDGRSPANDARARMANARSHSERALAQLDLREAMGHALTAAESARRERLRAMTGWVPRGPAMPDVSPSNVARTAVDNVAAAGRSPGINPGGAGPGAATPGINVTAPAIDADKLGQAMAKYLQPYVDRQIAAAESRAKAAGYGGRAQGGI